MKQKKEIQNGPLKKLGCQAVGRTLALKQTKNTRTAFLARFRAYFGQLEERCGIGTPFF